MRPAPGGKGDSLSLSSSDPPKENTELPLLREVFFMRLLRMVVGMDNWELLFIGKVVPMGEIRCPES